MNIRDTKTGMSGMNTEHLQYNEQEQNLKTFWPTRTLRPMPKFYWLTTPTPFQPKFYGPTLLTSFLTHATRAKICTTPPMLISWPKVTIGKKQGNKRMPYLLSKTLLLAEKKFKIFLSSCMTELATLISRSICIHP